MGGYWNKYGRYNLDRYNTCKFMKSHLHQHDKYWILYINCTFIFQTSLTSFEIVTTHQLCALPWKVTGLVVYYHQALPNIVVYHSTKLIAMLLASQTFGQVWNWKFIYLPLPQLPIFGKMQYQICKQYSCANSMQKGKLVCISDKAENVIPRLINANITCFT